MDYQKEKINNIDSTWDWITLKRTYIARVACVVSLLAAAVVCGIGAYYVISAQETVLAQTQYDSVTASALREIVDGFARKVHANQALSDSYAAQFDEIEQWPNVALAGFQSVSSSVSKAAAITTPVIAFCPKVTLEQQDSFEEFAAEYVGKNYPPGVGQTSEGVVIWKVNDSGDALVRDDTGVVSWDSSYQGLLFPMFEFYVGPRSDDIIPYGVVMTNMHQEPLAGASIDAALNCAASVDSETLSNDPVYCTVALIDPPSDDAVEGEEAYRMISIGTPVLLQDVLPNNTTEMVGILVFSVDLSELISDIVPGFVTGLDIVFEGSNGDTVSYTIDNGVAKFVADRAVYDPAYNSYRKQRALSDATFLHASISYYSVSIYPTRAFFQSYETETRWIASALAVAIILLTSAIFATYDHFMRHESTQKSIILEAKRAFVRYISHEIRTPLNTAYMGLRVLEDGLAKRLQLLQVEASIESKKKKTFYSPRKLQAMERNAALVEDVTDWASLSQDLLQSVHSAVDVLTSILNYDKVTSRTLSLETSLTPVWPLMKTTVEAFAMQAQQKNITLSLQLEPEFRSELKLQSAAAASISNDDEDDIEEARVSQLVKMLLLLGDEVHLAQVVRNLVSNALKFTPEGGTVTVVGKWEEHRTLPETDLLMNADTATSGTFSGTCLDSVISFFTCRSCFDSTASTSEQRKEESTVPLSPSVNRSGSGSKSSSLRSNNSASSSIRSTNSSTASSLRIPKADTQPAGELLLTVTDTGAGLSSEQLSMLFQEGVQFNRNRLQAGGGSGLGLSISKGIVKQHGGVLIADSAGTGRGCTFTLRLPLFHSEEVSKIYSNTVSSGHDSGGEGLPLLATDMGDDASLRASFELSVLPSVSGTSTRDGDERGAMLTSLSAQSTDSSVNSNTVTNINVLVVDDAALNRKMLIRLLKTKGHRRFVEATDGLDALDKYQHTLEASAASNSRPIELILMDYEMPRMDGPTCAKELRLRGCRIPIIGLTGNVMDTDIQFYKNHGASGVLGKPLDYAVLQELWLSIHQQPWQPVPGSDLDVQMKSAEGDIGTKTEPRLKAVGGQHTVVPMV